MMREALERKSGFEPALVRIVPVSRCHIAEEPASVGVRLITDEAGSVTQFRDHTSFYSVSSTGELIPPSAADYRLVLVQVQVEAPQPICPVSIASDAPVL